ncbi:MAG: heavy metal translocating P-type ATPase [Mucispirillum sp.]|nr:heavy metal translocating P-type ATPase [Mucispirillum sp.]
MDVKIVHKLPGRIRLHYNKGTLTNKQTILVKVLLSTQEGIKSININPLTCSILIYYSNISEKQILALFKALNDEYLNDEDMLNSINETKAETSIIANLFIIAAKHFSKALLPVPVRRIITVINTIPRIKQGLKTLILQKQLISETLDAAAISLSIANGDYNTAGSINFLLNIGETLEDYAKRKSYDNLAESLLNLQEQARVVNDNGQEYAVLAHTLKKDDKIIVRTGQTIHADGIIIQGEAMINQASITGESMPVKKEIDDAVYAGTLVEEGEIILKITAAGKDTKVSKIVKLIDDANNIKSAAQEKSEKLADKLVPYNFLLACSTYLITHDIIKTSSTLMVDYSCAMKLAAPIASLSAMKEAAKYGIIVKGGKFLEETANADTIIFDKTGTLTNASPKIIDIISFNNYSKEEVLKTAACLEEHFPHPLARAVVQEAANKGIYHKEEHAKVEYIVAHGIVSTLYNKKVAIGSEHFIFDDEKTYTTQEEKDIIQKASKDCSSILYLAMDNVLMGIILIDDPVLPNAAEVVDNLRKTGIKNIIMITGDCEAAAAKAAKIINADDYVSQALPEDKTYYVKQMRKNGYKVIMTGDGINDSPALASANAGIAMKGSSDIAGETADIILNDKGIESLYETRILGMELLKRISINNKIIIAGNSLLILAGLIGIIKPSTAALLHNTLTVSISAFAMQPMLKEKK